MYEKRTLPNGVRMVYEHMPHVRSAAIGVWIGVGSRYESPSNAGSAHFIEHMLFKGTAQHTASELAERMDAIGGQVNAYTTREGTCYYARVLDEHLDRAGDLLAEIDPRPFEAALGEARGALARDTAQLENARRDLSRYEKLVSGGHIARQQYDNQRALVRQYEGTVQSDKAAVDSAALQLQYSRITAPADGVLGLRKVDEGNMVHASDTEGLVRITLLTPSYVVFTLPESRVPLVAQHWREARKSGGRLLVQAWDREQQALLAQGFLLSMDNQIDTATGTVKLKAEFANEDHTLFPNQFVNARLLVTVLPRAVTVPTAAVQLGSRGSYVYVVDKDTVRLREVTPGVRTDSLTVIDKGLAAGEVVVVDGVDRLRDGLRVRVTASMETPRVTVPATGSGE